MRHLSVLLPVFASLALTSCVESPSSTPAAHAAASPDHIDVSSTQAPDLCASLATELTGLLAAAQSCHVAAANPTQCASWVPAISGCEQPVAAAASDATLAYMARFELYAQSCPLPDIACVDPSALSADCTQAADVDSLAGHCAITKTP